MPTPNLAQLKQAVSIAEQIEKLQAELAGLVGGRSSVASTPTASPASPIKKKKVMSRAARAKIGAAQKARWARVKATATATAKAPGAPKKKRKLSPEGRARIVTAAKARWATKKKSAAPSAKK
jgi:hypothetical protein